MTQKPEYAIILDFEATCDATKRPDPQEIIEFPSVLLSLKTLKKTDEFRAFVKPYHHPVLSEFCKTFTSIRQDDVDRADLFKDVFENHQMWLEKNGITVDNGVIVTCGDWDLRTMLPSQCDASVPAVPWIPPIYLRWHNIKRSFCSVRKRSKAPGMAGMLKDLGLPMKGHHHCGIDDCRNIAEICKTLVQKGARINPTAELSINKLPPLPLKLRLENRLEPATLSGRTMKGLSRLAGKVYKCQISDYLKQDGTKLSEDRDLLSIKPDEEIILIK